MRKIRRLLTFKQLNDTSSSIELRSSFNFLRLQRCIQVYSVVLMLAYGYHFTVSEALSQSTAEINNLQTTDSSKSYQLIWSDEFEEDGPPDPKNWNYERGFVRNKELQWYQTENAKCEDGLLVIEARRERVRNLDFDTTADNWRLKRDYAHYTSACLTTRGLHSWKYARIEVRARIDARDGLWPAIWTVGTSGRWPDDGEIDIMEYYQGHILANACWSSGIPWKPTWDAVKKPISDFSDPNWASNFHSWRMDWNEQRIELFVDDLLLNTIELNQTVGNNKQQIGPFHQPHYLLLNLAIGGTQGGDPAGTTFPAKFEVDYVRVYSSQ